MWSVQTGKSIPCPRTIWLRSKQTNLVHRWGGLDVPRTRERKRITISKIKTKILGEKNFGDDSKQGDSASRDWSRDPRNESESENSTFFCQIIFFYLKTIICWLNNFFFQKNLKSIWTKVIFFKKNLKMPMIIGSQITRSGLLGGGWCCPFCCRYSGRSFRESMDVWCLFRRDSKESARRRCAPVLEGACLRQKAVNLFCGVGHFAALKRSMVPVCYCNIFLNFPLIDWILFHSILNDFLQKYFKKILPKVIWFPPIGWFVMTRRLHLLALAPKHWNATEFERGCLANRQALQGFGDGVLADSLSSFGAREIWSSQTALQALERVWAWGCS